MENEHSRAEWILLTDESDKAKLDLSCVPESGGGS